MIEPYTIEQHKHRLAAWAAARAASSSKLCRFKVHIGVAILEVAGFSASFSSPEKLPACEKLDLKHRKWRNAVVAAAQNDGLIFSHGIAAKLINCYLKVRFVCGGFHEDERVKALHPPIDEVLLKELADQDVGGHAKVWKAFRNQRWSKFDSDTYEEVIALIRESLLPDERLWKVEEYWKGHQ
jgi:hypothetical protein